MTMENLCNLLLWNMNPIYTITLVKNTASSVKRLKKVMYEWCDEYQLKFFLAVHLLGAVPFFELNERYELAGSFLKKGHELFDELEIKIY